MQVFAQLCESIAATTRKSEKVRLLSDYFRSRSYDEARHAAVLLSGRAFPAYEETVLNVGGATLWRAVSEVADARDSEVATAFRRHGDLGAAAADILSSHKHRAKGPAVTIAEFETTLRAIAAARGPVRKLELLSALLLRLSPLEAKYALKIMSGDLRIGLRESLVEDAIALAYNAAPEHVRRANMLLGDISQTLILAAGAKLSEARMRIFHPIGMMLASPVEHSAEALDYIADFDGAAYIEDKYDGIRAQAHVDHGRARIFSRTMDDISASFPELVAALERLKGPLILDGEVLAWRSSLAQALPFSSLQQRLGRKNVTAETIRAVPVAFVAFDILYNATGLLIDLTLRERRSALERVLEAAPRGGEFTVPPIAQEDSKQNGLFSSHPRGESVPLPPLLVAPQWMATTPQQLDTVFDQAQARGNEGLMIKDAASTYLPGRRGKAWLKLKRELATLDVVVTSVEWGNGKRAALLSDFTFAVKDGDRLVNIGKAYSGLTDKEIARLTEWFKQHTIEDRGHSRLVEPTVIIEVAFNNVMVSDRHDSGYALRFPRIVRLRPDKDVDSIDTLDRVRELYEVQDRTRRAS